MTTIMRVQDGRLRPPRGRVAAMGLVLLVLAGAAVALGRADDPLGGSRSDDAATSATTVPGGTASGAGSEGGHDDSAESPAAPPALASVPLAGPRIVKTGELRVQVADGGFAHAAEESARVAQANGGFVESSSSSSFEEGRAAGDITIRVPSPNFDAARRSLGALGELQSEQVDGEDVTSQLVDLAARLRSLRAEEDVLNELLGRAANIGEVLQVRDRIAGVRLQVEQLAAQEASLDGAASLATLRVSLYEPAADIRGTTDGDDALTDRFAQAVDGSVAVLGGMIVVVGWLLPFAGLALLVWLGLRLWRRLPAPAGPA